MADHVERLLTRLTELRAALEAERERHEEAERTLLEERNEVFRALTQAGLSRRQIADAAGLTVGSVQEVIRPRPRKR
jgi:hypothetical protein